MAKKTSSRKKSTAGKKGFSNKKESILSPLKEDWDWDTFGFSTKEIVDWKKFGFSKPSPAKSWKNEGFSPKEAKEWIDTGIDNPEISLLDLVIAFKKEDITPDIAKKWANPEFDFIYEYEPSAIAEMERNKVDPTDSEAPGRYFRIKNLTKIADLSPQLEQKFSEFLSMYESKILEKEPDRTFLQEMYGNGIRIGDIFREINEAIRVVGMSKGGSEMYRETVSKIESDYKRYNEVMNDIHGKIYVQTPERINLEKELRNLWKEHDEIASSMDMLKVTIKTSQTPHYWTGQSKPQMERWEKEKSSILNKIEELKKRMLNKGFTEEEIDYISKYYYRNEIIAGRRS